MLSVIDAARLSDCTGVMTTRIRLPDTIRVSSFGGKMLRCVCKYCPLGLVVATREKWLPVARYSVQTTVGGVKKRWAVSQGPRQLWEKRPKHIAKNRCPFEKKFTVKITQTLDSNLQ